MAEKIRAIEIAREVAAQFPEKADRVKQVIVGTFDGEILTFLQTLEGKEAEPGDRFVLVPVVFPTFLENPEGVSTRAKDLRFQEYTLNVVAAEKHDHATSVKPWVVKQALVNDLLEAKLEPWAYAFGTTSVSQPSTDFNINHAHVSGGSFDIVTEVQKHGWVSASIAVTINIDSRR